MSTYNGEKYLREQLDSIFNQTNVNIKLLVRDDGSSDNTVNILKEYSKKKLLEWYSGENLGPAYSFLDVIMKPDYIDYDYFALCDQDDVWLSDKLSIGIDHLEKLDKNIPLLYYGCPRLVDKDLNSIPISKKAYQSFTNFYSSIIVSNATGCTFVFNKKLLNLVRTVKPSFIGMHDGWIHKICLSCGGKVYYDSDVHILYRQHGNNVVGISSSVKGSVRNFFNTLISRKNYSSRINKSIYDYFSGYMTEDCLQYLDLTINYKQDLRKYFRLLFSNKIRTSYFDRNLLFKIRVLLKRF